MDDDLRLRQRVCYRRNGTIVGGLIAEFGTNERTGDKLARIVDFHSEVKDPDAGRWVRADELFS